MLTGPLLNVMENTVTTEQIRKILASQHQEIRFSSYIPHITIGHYLDAAPTALIAKHLKQWQELSTLTLQAESIELVRFSATEKISEDIPLCKENYEPLATIHFDNLMSQVSVKQK